jgi:hypothetical protein
VPMGECTMNLTEADFKENLPFSPHWLCKRIEPVIDLCPWLSSC